MGDALDPPKPPEGFTIDPIETPPAPEPQVLSELVEGGQCSWCGSILLFLDGWPIRNEKGCRAGYGATGETYSPARCGTYNVWGAVPEGWGSLPDAPQVTHEAPEPMTPTRWWRVLKRDGGLWCETSDEQEARTDMPPGSRLQRLYERVQIEQEWLDMSEPGEENDGD